MHAGATGGADQHHDVAAISARPQRFDEDADLIDPKADGGSEHQAAGIGTGRGHGGNRR